MDAKTRERLVGALVLVAVIVLLVPALLKGPEDVHDAPPATGTRSVEIVLDDSTGPPEGEGLVPEREVARAAPGEPANAKHDAAEPKRPTAGAATAALRGPGKPPAPATDTRVAAGQQPAWAVQLGAFSSRGKADQLVAELRSRGYAAFVLEYRAGGQLLHRVRVGPEQDRARAAAVAERLRKDGFRPVVAPHP